MKLKKSKLDKLMPVVVGTCLISLAVSCGSNNDDDDSATPQQEETTVEGKYTLSLTPLNSSLFTNSPTGEGLFEVAGDDFSAEIKMIDAMATTHMQFVHAGGTCPTAAADTNGDGVIDAVEANVASGGILIPLDSNLKVRKSGNFPVGTNYNYSQSTSLMAMVADMRLPVEDPNSSYVALGENEELRLSNRVVMIHGTPTSVTLPATAQGMDGMTANRSLPIACGVITKVPDETPEPTPVPEPTPQPVPTPQPTPQPQPQPTPQPTPEPVPQPTPQPTPTA